MFSRNFDLCGNVWGAAASLSWMWPTHTHRLICVFITFGLTIDMRSQHSAVPLLITIILILRYDVCAHRALARALTRIVYSQSIPRVRVNAKAVNYDKLGSH